MNNSAWFFYDECNSFIYRKQEETKTNSVIIITIRIISALIGFSLGITLIAGMGYFIYLGVTNNVSAESSESSNFSSEILSKAGEPGIYNPYAFATVAIWGFALIVVIALIGTSVRIVSISIIATMYLFFKIYFYLKE